jgi:hypothetical protein
MALRDPVAVYNAANNFEAHLLRNALSNAGVEAFVMEDISEVPQVLKPQVWVERADFERVKPIFDDYERRAAELRDASTHDEERAGLAMEVVCEKCGKRSAFPASQLGSVQQCQHCGAYVDIVDDSPLRSRRTSRSPSDRHS